MVKVSMNGDGDLFLLAEILDGLNLNMEQFQRMCIAAGCDYLKSIKGIGIKRAFQIVISEHNMMNMIKWRQCLSIKLFLTWKSVSLFLCRRVKPSFLQMLNISVESMYHYKFAKSTMLHNICWI